MWSPLSPQPGRVAAGTARRGLLAPVAYHRLVFRRQEKENLGRAANVLAILGLAVAGLAVSSAVALWFALPLARRR